MSEVFHDRVDAGRRLAARLSELRGHDVVVLGLPRGGVPVAAEVASALEAPLDVVVVRKLGVPSQPELAMGAIGEDGVKVLDQDLIRRIGITPQEIDAVEHRERETLAARVHDYRSGAERRDLAGRTVLIVDDGIATGATASAACDVVRGLGAAHVIVAAPVCAPRPARRVPGADEVVCLLQPPEFYAVGEFYREFRQTTDAEVIDLLRAARRFDRPPHLRAGDDRWP